MKTFIVMLISNLKEWFGPVAGAVYRSINWTEFHRIAITALSSGGSLLVVLQALKDQEAAWFQGSPIMASLLSTLIVACVESIRRYYQGRKPQD